MRINTSLDRWLHLLVLCFFTGVGGYALIYWFDWKPLSAISLSCVVTVQVNNAIRMLMEGGIPTDETATGSTTAATKSSGTKQE